jgi:hypothetical protein
VKRLDSETTVGEWRMELEAPLRNGKKRRPTPKVIEQEAAMFRQAASILGG